MSRGEAVGDDLARWSMPEFHKNLWAPWRMEYIRSLEDEQKEDGCFLCRYWRHPDQDCRHLVLWRTPHVFVLLNRFPYTNGHLLVACGAHRGGFRDLTEDALTDLARAVRDAVEVLARALRAEGFNVGYNFGRCAGAGLPDHLHAHVVPRWSGDTNFMAVIGDARVIPDALEATWSLLRRAAGEMGLPVGGDPPG